MNRLLTKLASSVTGIMLCVANAWAAPNLPRLSQSDLVYQGAFRVPRGDLGGGENFAFGGGPIGFNPARNSLFLGTYNSKFVEISIPQPVNTSSTTAMPIATLMQAANDVTNGTWRNIGAGGATIGNSAAPGGILYYNNKLISTSWGYYDANNDSVLTHFTASPNWVASGNQFSGFYQVGPYKQTGLIAGYLATIPPEWQADFGGPALTGLGSIAIFNRTSAGPAASVFDPAQIGVVNPVPATAIVQYPQGYRTFGGYEGTSLYYNMGTQLRGLVFPAGSRSVLFFGRQGLGSTGQGNGCYGSGTASLSEAKNPSELCAWFAANPTQATYACGGASLLAANCGIDPCCYDPSSGGKGDHAYPYVYYVWAYDANDLLSAKSGTYKVSTADYTAGRFVTDTTTTPATLLSVGQIVQPWNVKPYGLWRLTLPTSPNTIGDEKIMGAAYDPATQRIFITQYSADMNGPYEPLPLVHVFKVNATLSAAVIPAGTLRGQNIIVK